MGPIDLGGRVNRRVDERLAIATGTVGGLLAATSDAAPTGSSSIDTLLVVASVGLVIWASATAPWWAVATMACVSAAIAGSMVDTIVGVLALVVALWFGISRRDVPVVRTLVTAVALNLLIRSDLEQVFGLSAIIAITTATVVLVLGVQGRVRATRRIVWLGLISVGSIGVLAVLGLAFAGALAAPDLTDGSRFATAGIESLNDGDYTGAADRFDEAAQAFGAVEDALGMPWARAAGAVPVVAQNRTAAFELAGTAARTTSAAADALRLVDPEDLRLVGGQIDLAAIEAIQQPFADVQSVLDDLDATLARISSPWIVAPLADRLLDLSRSVEDASPRVDNAARAAQLAPEMLGGDGPRRYFVGFSTSARTQGLGGTIETWAEVTADDGRLEVAAFGRTADLDAGDPLLGEVAAPDDWLTLWGARLPTGGPGGDDTGSLWSQISGSPDFRSTGAVIADAYARSGGSNVDGVFVMDQFVLEAFLGLTGPITIGGSSQQLTGDDLAQFLLVDQYEIPAVEGSPFDPSEAAALATATQVLAGALPGPSVVADALSPLAAQGRIVGWARDGDVQELFEHIRLDGALPEIGSGDGLAVVLNNMGDNRLDAYLFRELDYVAVIEAPDDAGAGDADPVDRTWSVAATATLRLTNRAPSSGLPATVTGPDRGDPVGTNRTLVSLYSGLSVVSASVMTTDTSGESAAEPFDVDLGEERCWLVATGSVVIPPGGTVTISYELTGDLGVTEAAAYSLAMRPQPIVIDEIQTVDVSTSDGRVLIYESGRAVERRVLTPS